MKLVAFDSETALFRPGTMAPELTCVTYQSPGEPAGMVHRISAEPLVRGWLEDPEVVLTGANTAYDMGVLAAEFPDLLPLIFDAYEAGRVTDVQIRQKLLDIASGRFQGYMGQGGKWTKPKYSLDDLTHKYLGKRLDKDTWRMRYGEFRDVLFPWPEGATMYPLDDAIATLAVHQFQEAHVAHIPTQFFEAHSAFVLHLASAWGLRTDPARVAELERHTLLERNECLRRLELAGLVRADGTRDMKAAAAHMVDVCSRDGLPLRMTDGGNVALDADACEETSDPVLLDYARFVKLGSVINKDVKALAQGVTFPIHTRFGLVASGRTSSSGPNVQNWSRSGA